ncbi:hypothetical protein HMPREF0063_11608 [Aeromicrobium marinum DSM 15272]|uniref:Uncharacterized protein n=1 Tax=Aeromicrobium marinum DSM 15272 TaxID=585531 RepID=E2SC49_9ACTN|nr:DUF3180 domain-containing protein [Aeromicrobium marinum]EFQ83335.1 hypothetical protein HMPREF0063_11608 [Aeromicrobium marinum DSM 15272]
MRPVRRTSALTIVALVGVGLVVGAGIPPLAMRLDRNAPLLSWGSVLVIAVAAAVVGLVAWNTWDTVHRQKKRVHHERGVLLLALAQASSRVGALFAGGYAGFALAFVDTIGTEFGQDRVVRGGVAVLASVGLLVAGLLLERACRLPSDDDEDDDDGTSAEASPA